MAQPDLIPMPFAENATPGTIEPIEATTPTMPQDATWSTGFPQVTMQPLAAGGIPPRGQNFNGVLNALSRHIFHMQGGGQYKWSDDHGPYSIGDVLQSDDGLRAYVSIVNNNTDNFNTNPSAIGTSWLPWSGGAASELVAGLIQIATSAETQTGTNATKAVTPSSLSSRTSTESRTGLIQLATTAEAQALTDDTKALTPKKLADAFLGVNRSVSGTDGYQIFPGGLALQWVSRIQVTPSGLSFTWPLAFTEVLGAWGSHNGGAYLGVNVSSLTNVGGVLRIDASTGTYSARGYGLGVI